MPGESVGRYRLIRKLATGGMAEIWLATAEGPEGFKKRLVVKRILPNLAEDDEFVRMFLDEARIAARLNHPNIAQIFDLGEADGSFYLAMEFVPGKDLRRVYQDSAKARDVLPVPLTARILVESAKALDYAHRAVDDQGRPLQIVHRDVSPQNILVTYQGGVKLVDFGIAKAADQATHTRSGVLKGKYSYMSPEQAAGNPIDGRTDIFALGIVGYELVTGFRLFKRDNEIQTLQAVRECKVPVPSQVARGVPRALDRILGKALAKKTADRYATAGELALELEEFLLQGQHAASSTHLAEFMRRIYGDSPDGGEESGVRSVPGDGSGSRPSGSSAASSGRQMAVHDLGASPQDVGWGASPPDAATDPASGGKLPDVPLPRRGERSQPPAPEGGGGTRALRPDRKRAATAPPGSRPPPVEGAVSRWKTASVPARGEPSRSGEKPWPTGGGAGDDSEAATELREPGRPREPEEAGSAGRGAAADRPEPPPEPPIGEPLSEASTRIGAGLQDPEPPPRSRSSAALRAQPAQAARPPRTVEIDAADDTPADPVPAPRRFALPWSSRAGKLALAFGLAGGAAVLALTAPVFSGHGALDKGSAPSAASDGGCLLCGLLPRAQGKLTVVTEPPAKVFVGDEELGSTPLVEAAVSAGPLAVHLVNDAVALDATVPVEITEGKLTLLRKTFPQGSIALPLGKGRTYHVFCHGQPLGRVPGPPIAMVEGTHVLTIVDDQSGEKQEKTVEVKALVPRKTASDARPGASHRRASPR